MDNRQRVSSPITARRTARISSRLPRPADAVVFMTQTLEYNCGDLTDPATKPIDPSSSVFVLREIFNFLAMCAMLAMLVPLAAILCKTSFFAACVGKNEHQWPRVLQEAVLAHQRHRAGGRLPDHPVDQRTTSWRPRSTAATSSRCGPPSGSRRSSWACLPRFSLIELAVCCAIDKKRYGSTNLPQLNIALGLKGVLKSLLDGVHPGARGLCHAGPGQVPLQPGLQDVDVRL